MSVRWAIISLLLAASILSAGCARKSPAEAMVGTWSGPGTSLVLQAGGQGTWNQRPITWREAEDRLYLDGSVQGMFQYVLEGKNLILHNPNRGADVTLTRQG